MPRTSTAVLYDGDDFDDLARLRLAYDLAAEKANELKAPGGMRSQLPHELPDVDGARQAYTDAVTAAAERAVEVKVQDIGSKRWRELIAEHQPRKDNPTDQYVGYNTDSFPEALLKFDDGNRRTILEPAYDRKDDRNDWLDDISSADFEQILDAALRVNRGQLADPKDVRSLSAPVT